MRRSLSLMAGVFTVLAMTAVGCQQPLFPEELPRTQYERFDRMRGAYTPKDSIGPYGDPVPALRERLQPYE